MQIARHLLPYSYLLTVVVGGMYTALPSVAQDVGAGIQCPSTPQQYQADYQQKPKDPFPMVCYQYAVQRDPSTVAPITTADVERKELRDVFGKKVRDKEIFDEVWQPLPGFAGLFYDTKTFVKYYTDGTHMLQIPGTSTLGDNPFKVSIQVDCDAFRLSYTGVAKRLTRIYDYDGRYQISGAFPREQVQQLCYELGDPPAKIRL